MLVRRVLVTMAAGVAIAGAIAAPADAAVPGPSPSPLVINLQQAFMQALPAAWASPPAGVVPTVDSARSAALSVSLGAVTAANLSYHGGPVQHNPRVYLLLWGPGWGNDTGQATIANYLVSFYSGLGVAPQDTWSTITEQYQDNTGGPSFGGPTFAGVYEDVNAPPADPTATQLAAEVDGFAKTVGIDGDINAQVVLATQSGVCPQGIACGQGFACAYHSIPDSGVPFTVLPSVLSEPECRANQVQGPYDGYSTSAGHEYAETITDPNPGTGWINQSSQEIGDLCNNNLGTVTLYTGTFTMQQLWSNDSGGCTMTPAMGQGLRQSPTSGG